MAPVTPPCRTRRGRRQRGALVAGTALILLPTGCTGQDTGVGADQSLSEQTWLVPQDWGAIDPTKEAATNIGAILMALEPLVLATQDGAVRPNLATQSQPDPTTYVYTVRSGVKFSDGAPLTMDDILYSFRIHMGKDSTSNMASFFTDVKSIAITGEHQLTIKLKHPNVQFPNAVAETGIVERKIRKANTGNPGSPGHLNVGTGPFVVSSYAPGNKVVFARNDNYWGKRPAAERITLRLIQDDSARLAAVQSGEITGAFEIPPSQAPVYKRIRGMKIIRGASPSTVLLNLNIRRAPWNDVHVRRAIALALDKNAIVTGVLRGNGKASASVVPTDILNKTLSAQDVAALDKYPFDIAAAKAELAKSSIPGGVHATLMYTQARGSTGLVAQVVAQRLEKIGIKLDIKSVPDAQFTEQLFFKHTAPPSIVDYQTDIPDPISLANYLSNSDNTLAKGGYTNIAEYNSPRQDQILQQYLELPATATKRRSSLLSQALHKLADDEPYVPLYNADYLAVIRKDLTFDQFDGMWWMRRWVDSVHAAG
ncbi:ABC transporter substrate-binding protein [Wenjunlia tyrosinilytica]|uniref:ABC transporter substrate-binding protein n=1 Tax=Wenjunlia tyrosinilytica TaxID=1544741 RepID=A0A917ZYE3_9ACTN|nr:ABC transporter substrate-binding protein [Wenjunlia tyrosinilytica]GGO97228.1 ABC transporter substrate-binding protein [Wenjunlia tyrosinilytica]